jgi:hypothetical protein
MVFLSFLIFHFFSRDFFSFWENFLLLIFFGTKKNNKNFSSNVSNRSGSKIETRSTFMALQATLAEKASLKGESEDNDDW